MNAREPQRVYDEAVDYLLTFEAVDRGLLDDHLHDREGKAAGSVEELYRGLLVSAQNRQGMPNSIGDVSQLEGVLCDFDPARVRDRYASWEDVFRRVERSEVVSPPGRFDIENAHSHWVQFSKSVVSAADFLADFEDVAAFDALVSEVTSGENSERADAPRLLSAEVHGIGFATACDFLKESGYRGFVKPDTHVRDIFVGAGVSDPDADDVELFDDAVAFASAIGATPYEVDKLFWIVGSGRFPNATAADGSELRVQTDKSEFLDRL